MSETTAEHLVEVPTYELAPDDRFDLTNVLEIIKREPVIRYRVLPSPERDAALANITSNLDFKEKTEEYPFSAELRELYKLEAVWKLLAQPYAAADVYHGMVCRYDPGTGFTKHIDTNLKPDSDYEPAEALSFVYVLSGEKDILFYLDGPDETATSVRQQPGDLFIFRGGGAVYDDGTETFGLYHEVPPQDVSNMTLSWEMVAKSRLHA